MKVFLNMTISDKGLKAYEKDFEALHNRLKQLEADSPYEFTIIGRDRTTGTPTNDAIISALSEAHEDIYVGKPYGQPYRRRVETASAVFEKAALSQNRPPIVTRVDAMKAYNVAHAIFSPEFDIASLK
jgi:hypothetical protein